MRIVAIEGNVGVGKSTLLDGLVESLEAATGEKWEHVVEPVDKDPEFLRLLQLALADTTNGENRAKFQWYLTESRQNMLKDLPEGNYIVERTLFSDLAFSMAMMIEVDSVGSHYMLMMERIKYALSQYPKIDAVVYLDRHPEACMESIIKRGREGEVYEMYQLWDIKRFHDATLPQIARKFNTPLIKLELGHEYANPKDVALAVLEVLDGTMH